MANFNNLALTYRGAKALLEAQTGTTLTLSKIGLGSGTTTGNIIELTGMVDPEIMMPISNKIIDNEANHITLVAKMTNEDINEGFYWRETGLFFADSEGNDVLFAYACVSEGDQYDYVPAYSDQRYVKHVRIANVIAGEANITITENTGLLYVDVLTYEEFLKEYAEHVKTFEEHIGDTDNPHEVTAKQVGLGNVPNVTTNNQTPTYTTASALARLVSGEKLSVAFGKIARAINNLISHLASVDNPHKVTAKQLKALTKDNLANNLSTIEEGYGLDARQGKVIWDRMQNMKYASITAHGTNTALGLEVDTPTKVPLNKERLQSTGFLPAGTKYLFELVEDENGCGIKCPYTGTLLVSGSAFITGETASDIVNKGCIIRRKTVDDKGTYGAEMDVCSQFIRDVGVAGGISAGTIAISVQDGDVFYLYARSSAAARCDTTSPATYLSLTYLSIG